MLPLFPLLVLWALLPLPSLGLTIPTALLCLDPDLEQHLLAGVTMPDAIASIVSQVGAARQSVCSSSVVSPTGGAESTIDTPSPTSTSQASLTPLPTPLGGASLVRDPLNLSGPTSFLASSTVVPTASSLPSLSAVALNSTGDTSKVVPIVVGVLVPLVVIAAAALLFILLRRRRRRQRDDHPSPYVSNIPQASTSVDLTQQPFWRSIGRRPAFVQMPTSSTVATLPWDPLPPRPGGSRSTLPLRDDADMSEQRVLYLVGSRGTALTAGTPGTMTGVSDGGGFPWGQSETELGGGRGPTGRAVEIERRSEASMRTGGDSMSLARASSVESGRR